MNKRELQAKQTLETLLNVSTQLIIEKGYHNVSINEICKKSKVAKGTFYIYFNSKTDIILKILADVSSHIFEKNWDNYPSAEEQLKEYIHSYLTTIASQGVDFTRIVLQIIIEERLNMDTDLAHLHQQLVHKIINYGKETGEIRKDISTETLERYLQGFIYGVLVDWCKYNGEYDIVHHGQQAILTYFDTMRTSKST